MYAIVELGGQQWKVEEDQKIKVNKIDAEIGKTIDVKDVLLYADDNNVKIGKPVVKNAVVKAEVVSHGKGKKVLVFKKKRRKKYRVLKGHRQDYTELTIKSIEIPGIVKMKSASASKAAEKKTEKADKEKVSPKPKKETETKTSAKTKKTAESGKKTSGSKKTAKTTTKKSRESDTKKRTSTAKKGKKSSGTKAKSKSGAKSESQKKSSSKKSDKSKKK